jgi:uncharacterized protein YegP (UPF0339 family)
MRDRFELRNCGDQYFFVLRAARSLDVLLTGELCATKAAALKAIETVRLNAMMDRRYERRVSASSGLPYFVICSVGQELLATSRIFSSALLRNEAIANLKATVRRAVVEDETHPQVRRSALAEPRPSRPRAARTDSSLSH